MCTERAKLAEETVETTKKGFYHLKDGQKVVIQAQVEKCLEDTRYFSPEDLDVILEQVLQSPPLLEKTLFEIQNETTLQGVQRLVVSEQFPQVVALNFASAKNPGGGFLSGSQAQEESLARSSALYKSLCKAPQYHEEHRSNRSSLYSHRMILSPACPVFRDDNGQLLSESYAVTFISSAAPNAGALMQNQSEELVHVPSVLRERAARVLALAVYAGANAVVLGAWGCGVFRNNPATVASVFGALFEPGGDFERSFHTVLFSVLDTSDTQVTYRAFNQAVTLLKQNSCAG